jgi:hypothetical protein
MLKFFMTSLVLFSVNLYGQTAEDILKDIAAREKRAVELVDLQLKGYNERNIDLFVEAYSDDVEVYTFPDVLKYKGKENLRASYEGSFNRLVNRKAKIVNRVVYGSHVIDHEEITGLPNDITVHAVALYVIENDKISKVYFLRQL